MMPGDVTILEGPVTPAPLFAYRALRSIFFASPDSSPEHCNKENIVPAYASLTAKSRIALPKSPQVTPSQGRKKEHIADEGVVLSPTKGILRTPGLATPRAKFLKDVNVKFKSVSPEARQQDDVALKSEPLTTKAKNAPVLVRDSQPLPHLAPPSILPDQEPAEPQTKTSGDTCTIPTDPIPPAAFEAYVAQNEKEMRKLVRYSKKMREYAMKKDMENQELRLMIQSLRKENERFRHPASSNANAERNDEHSDSLLFLHGEEMKSERERRTKTGGTIVRTKTKAISPALRNKARGHVRDEVDRVETTVRRLSLVRETLAPHAKNPSLEARPASIPPATNPPEQIQRISNDAPSERPASQEESKPAQIEETLWTTVPDPTVPKRAISGYTPNREAAVRERLRKRVEARRASDRSEAAATSDARGRAKAKEGAAMTEKPALEEQSDFWAGL